jgi:hypothetical protein
VVDTARSRCIGVTPLADTRLRAAQLSEAVGCLGAAGSLARTHSFSTLIVDAAAGAEQSLMVKAVEVAARRTHALSEHDLEAALACFHPDYRDHAPARRGEVVEGREQVRANFARPPRLWFVPRLAA